MTTLSPDELASLAETAAVFAKVSPSQKAAIIDAWHRKGACCRISGRWHQRRTGTRKRCPNSPPLPVFGSREHAWPRLDAAGEFRKSDEGSQRRPPKNYFCERNRRMNHLDRMVMKPTSPAVPLRAECPLTEVERTAMLRCGKPPRPSLWVPAGKRHKCMVCWMPFRTEFTHATSSLARVQDTKALAAMFC